MVRRGLVHSLLILVSIGVLSTGAFAQTIRIGIELSLTGYAATYGEDAKRGTELAIDEINNAGGVNGKKLEAVYEDDGGVGKTAVSATQKLIGGDKVSVIIGGITSSAALSAAPLAKENKVVFLASFCSHPELTGPGGYVYRLGNNIREEAKTAGRFAARVLKLKKSGSLAATSDYGRNFAKFTRDSFEEEGGTSLLAEEFAVNANDFRSQLTKIKAKNPEILFVAATVKEAAQILRQMTELRMKIPVYSSSMFDDPLLVKLAGESAENVYYIRVGRVPGEEGKKKEKIFNKKFKDKFPGKEPAICAVYYYDGIGLIFTAIKLAGETGPDIDRGMRKIRDYPGLTGNITFNEIGDRDIKNVTMKIEKGKPVEIGSTSSN